tara:strand:- start:40 stop:648 length:609 start_codon:yes stop_codon:yes gene_type:complete
MKCKGLSTLHRSKYDLNRQITGVFSKGIQVGPSDRQLLQARKFRVIERTEQRAEGPVCQEIIVHPGAVAIIPIVDAERLCLIKNRRMAVGETLLELPAGTQEVGESPRVTATRELREETGFSAETMVPLGSCWMSPGILREKVSFFVARGLTGGTPALEKDEQIENYLLTLREAVEMIFNGQITDAKTIVGLLLFERLGMTR